VYTDDLLLPGVIFISVIRVWFRWLNNTCIYG